VNGSRGVVYAMLVAFGIFTLAGDQGSRRLANGIARATGQPTTDAAPNEGRLSPQNLFGWAVLFVILIALADIDSTAALASAFAFLVMVTVLLAFGPDAFNNITRMLGGQVSTTPTGGAPTGSANRER
jgi:hypothetical protein